MINIFSSLFQVKPEENNTLIWFITDVCNLELKNNNYGYYFYGISDGYLTGVVIDLEEVKRLGIDKYEVLSDEPDLAIVDFNSVLSKLVKESVHYYEFDPQTSSIVGTLITSDGKVKSISEQLDMLMKLNEC